MERLQFSTQLERTESEKVMSMETEHTVIWVSC